MDKDYYAELEAAFEAILKGLSAVVTADEVLEVKELVEDHGEYGLALEILSAVLIEGRKTIPREVLDRIVALDTRMGHSNEVDIEALKSLGH